MEIADALVSSGMKEVGYEYINLDDGWQDQPTVDADGKPVYNKTKFPRGMKHIADYVHSKGLKFGIYSRPAWVKGNETEVARTFAEWGVDFIKYDFSDRLSNEKMIWAVRAAGRPITFSACEWGSERPWEWAGKMGAQLWRTSYDVVEAWFLGADRNSGLGILDAIHQTEYLVSIPQPGWNDPDMLVIGLGREGHVMGGGASPEEYRSQFSLWSMACAPLLVGNDLRNMDATVQAILTNKALIAIQKDPLFVPTWRVKKMSGYEIWKKPLKNGDIVIGVLNLGAGTETLRVDLDDLHLEGDYRGTDVWADKFLGEYDKTLSLEVKSHETVVLRFSKRR